MLEQLLLPMLLVAGVGAVSIGGCGVVVVSVQILPACNHGQIWAEVRVQAGRWWWWSWVVVGNWGWMVGGSRCFVVDSVRDPLLIFYDIRYVDILRISILLGLSFFNVCIFF